MNGLTPYFDFFRGIFLYISFIIKYILYFDISHLSKSFIYLIHTTHFLYLIRFIPGTNIDTAYWLFLIIYSIFLLWRVLKTEQ